MVDIYLDPRELAARPHTRIAAWFRRIGHAIAVRRRYLRRQRRRLGGRELSRDWMLALPQSRSNG